MIGFGLILLAIGVGDLVAGGLAGEPGSRPRAAAGLAAAVIVVAAGGGFLELGLAGTLASLALVILGDGAWLFLRLQRPLQESTAWWALAALGAVLLTALGMSGLWPEAPAAAVAEWLEDLPFRFLARLEPGYGSLLVGALVFLLATTNGVVRAVLTTAGTPAQRSEQRLRGGRLIGPIERLLIFGLAIAGEPTAAALIVSAKSILRFPELSRKAGAESPDVPVAEVDFVTEYFVLGSLVSWLAALAPTVLFRP